VTASHSKFFRPFTYEGNPLEVYTGLLSYVSLFHAIFRRMPGLMCRP
jgi:hypothetical protein